MNEHALVPLTGSPLPWARDFAVVGGVTGFAAPYVVITDLPFAAAAGLAGAALGLVLGALAAPFLERARHRVPLLLLVFAAPFVGAVWGGLSGVAGGLVGGRMFAGESVELGLVMGAAAGMVQLGWMFLPYTLVAVMKLPRWPVVLAASVAAPVFGFLAVLIVLGLWIEAPLAFLGAVTVTWLVAGPATRRALNP